MSIVPARHPPVHCACQLLQDTASSSAHIASHEDPQTALTKVRDLFRIFNNLSQILNAMEFAKEGKLTSAVVHNPATNHALSLSAGLRSAADPTSEQLLKQHQTHSLMQNCRA